MECEQYASGCVLEWDGVCLELRVCERHKAEYHEAYNLKAEENTLEIV